MILLKLVSAVLVLVQVIPFKGNTVEVLYCLIIGMAASVLIKKMMKEDIKMEALCTGMFLYTIAVCVFRSYAMIHILMVLYPVIAVQSFRKGKNDLLFMLMTVVLPVFQLMLLKDQTFDSYFLQCLMVLIQTFITAIWMTGSTGKNVMISLMGLWAVILYEASLCRDTILKGLVSHWGIGLLFLKFMHGENIVIDAKGCAVNEAVCGGDLFTLLGFSRTAFLLYFLLVIVYILLLFKNARSDEMKLMAVAEAFCILCCFIRCIGFDLPYGYLPFEGYSAIRSFALIGVMMHERE